MMQDDTPSGSQRHRSTHGGHRERIFTEPVMEVLIEQLGQHYYRIRDHLEKPQAVVTEIADTINKKIPGLSLQPMQVYGRMINLQNSLRRYWESIAVGDYKKKPRYYELLCKVFGTDYNAAGAVQSEEFINGGDDLDSNSPNHITVELPEFFDANTLGSGQYTTGTTTASTHRTAASGSGREDLWTPQLTKVLLQAMEECIGMLRSRPDKFKAWKIILGAVNVHVFSNLMPLLLQTRTKPERSFTDTELVECDSQPLSVYQVKVKVKRMLGAVRKYERQAARGQLFVDKPFYYDTIKTLFRKELKPYQHNSQSAVLDGVESFGPRRTSGASSLSLSMTSFMRRTSQLLEESLQIQREMRDEMRDYHAKVLDQLRTFNDTYRMVAMSVTSGGGARGAKRKRLDEEEEEDDDDGVEDEYEEVEELLADDDPSDIEEGIVEQEEFDGMQVATSIM